MMKLYMLLALIFVGAGVTAQTADTAWIKDFRAFRDAVYQGNKAKAKTFVDFTAMKKEDTEIWSLVHWDDEGEFERRPFGEADFDRYFNKVFTKQLIKGVLRIKSADLGKKGESESPEFKEGDTLRYKVYASTDYKEKTFTLNLSLTSYVKDEKGTVDFGGETSIIYIFSIVDKTRIRFKQVRIAG